MPTSEKDPLLIPTVLEDIQPSNTIALQAYHCTKTIKTEKSDTKIEVDLLASGAGFWVMDSANYSSFLQGKKFQCIGKHFGGGVRLLLPPQPGEWLVVAHLNGKPVKDIEDKWYAHVVPVDQS